MFCEEQWLLLREVVKKPPGSWRVVVDPAPCELCEPSLPFQPVVALCESCESQRVCAAHVESAHGGHNVVLLAEAASRVPHRPAVPCARPVSKCSKHPDCDMDSLCLRQRKLLCRLCAAEACPPRGPNHRHLDIDELRDTFCKVYEVDSDDSIDEEPRRFMPRCFRSADKFSFSSQRVRKAMCALKEQRDATIATYRKDVEDALAVVVQKARERAEEFVAEVRKECDERLKALEAQADELEVTGAQLRAYGHLCWSMHTTVWNNDTLPDLWAGRESVQPASTGATQQTLRS